MAAQSGLSLTWSKTPKEGFLVTRLTYSYSFNVYFYKPFLGQYINVYVSADIVRLLSTWKNPRLLHATGFAKKYEPLMTITDRELLECRHYVNITIGILKMLDFLHEKDLIQDDFAADDIRVKVTDTVRLL